jgi:chromosome segregation ATPase
MHQDQKTGEVPILQPQLFYELESIFTGTRRLEKALRDERERSSAIAAEIERAKRAHAAALAASGKRTDDLSRQTARLTAQVKSQQETAAKLQDQVKYFSRHLVQTRTDLETAKVSLAQERRRSSEIETALNQSAGRFEAESRALRDSFETRIAELSRANSELAAESERLRGEISSARESGAEASRRLARYERAWPKYVEHERRLREALEDASSKNGRIEAERDSRDQIRRLEARIEDARAESERERAKADILRRQLDDRALAAGGVTQREVDAVKAEIERTRQDAERARAEGEASRAELTERLQSAESRAAGAG